MVSPLIPIITPALLASLRKHPALPPRCWYFIAASALTILNRPDEIPKIYKDAIDKGHGPANDSPGLEEQLTISRRMREALVKTTAIGGLPKVGCPVSVTITPFC